MVRSDSSVSGVTGYDLDGAGNRLFVSGGSDPGQYLLDPALPVPGDFQCNQYTDTPRGPRLYDESGSDLSGVVYDYRDQMVQATGGGGAIYLYRYDALGNRVEKQDSTTLDTIRYYWMDGHVLEEQDLSNLPRATYVYGGRVDGVLQFHEEQDLDGDLLLETYWYLADHLLSVQALTDSLGVAVESYDYGDYGNPEIFDGSGTSLGISSAKGNPYMFTGLEFQGEVYLYTFGNRGARYMDPRAGRFISRDPQGVWGDAGNTGNAFSYAGSNPLSHRPTRSRHDGVISSFHWTQVQGPYKLSDPVVNPLNRPAFLHSGRARRGPIYGATIQQAR